MGWRVRGAHAQKKKQFPGLGVVREGFLEEEKLKPERVCWGMAQGFCSRVQSRRAASSEAGQKAGGVLAQASDASRGLLFISMASMDCAPTVCWHCFTHWARSSEWAAGEGHFSCR